MMWKLGIWDQHEGAVISTISGNGNMYEAFFEWLIEEDEQKGQFWRVAGSALMQGWQFPHGVGSYDEVIVVWALDVGVDHG